MNQINNINQLDNKIKELIQEYDISGIGENILKDIWFYNTEILPKLSLRHGDVEIRNSPIHGKGLFATKNIPKDAIIAFYPTHGIYVDEKHNTYFDPLNENNEQIEVFKSNILNNDYLNTYSYTYFRKSGISLVGDPERIDNKNTLGHMINDASVNVFQNIKYDDRFNIDTHKTAMLEYYSKGKLKRNCTYAESELFPICCCIALKNIKPNEEILILYEHRYWYDLTYNQKNRTNSEVDSIFSKCRNDTKFMNKFASYH